MNSQNNELNSKQNHENSILQNCLSSTSEIDTNIQLDLKIEQVEIGNDIVENNIKPSPSFFKF